MINLNECKFGDRLKMRNGDNMHGSLHQYDIIGKWEDEE